MSANVSRRDFLKLGALSLAGLAFKPAYNVGEILDGDQIPTDSR
jgi:hypothetical protein